MADPTQPRRRTYHYEQHGAYRLRMLLAVAVALGLVVAVVRLPLHPEPMSVGWRAGSWSEPIFLSEVAEQPDEPADEERAPITQFGLQENEPPTDEGRDDDAADAADEEPPRRRAELQPLEGRQVLEFAEVSPRIEGGLGAYYINIQYPKAAQAAGIQGRLVLQFVVQPSGIPSDITVLQSLHPLCDSAAVQALRGTRFVPGRQNGEKVAVRMRLPVRFTLLNVQADSNATSDGADARRDPDLVP